MSYFNKLLICTITVCIVGIGAIVYGFDPGEQSCSEWKVIERIQYLKTTGDSLTKQVSLKYRVTCSEQEQIIKTNKTFPLGSTVALEWVQQ